MAQSERLIRKLRLANKLDADDIEAIETLPIRVQTLAPHAPVVRQGESPDYCCLIADGLAYRSKTTLDGKRQILALHVAGDIPDLQSLHLKVMDCDLRSAGTSVVGLMRHEDLKKLCRSRPNVAESLWKETLIDASKYREWITNIGQRPAEARMAHLIAELDERLSTLGLLAEDGPIQVPLTQTDLADCLGLTPVHVNRVTKTLRRKKIADFRRGTIHVLDRAALREMCGFDPLYLHQSPEL